VLTQSEADRIGAEEAKAEELRCRNVIEACGWSVERVTTWRGRSHYSIVKEGRQLYGSPKDLARACKGDRPKRSHQEQRHD
jgi:hypothetical protein